MLTPPKLVEIKKGKLIARPGALCLPYLFIPYTSRSPELSLEVRHGWLPIIALAMTKSKTIKELTAPPPNVLGNL